MYPAFDTIWSVWDFQSSVYPAPMVMDQPMDSPTIHSKKVSPDSMAPTTGVAKKVSRFKAEKLRQGKA